CVLPLWATGVGFTSLHVCVNIVRPTVRLSGAAKREEARHGSAGGAHTQHPRCGKGGRRSSATLWRSAADGGGDTPPTREHPHLDRQPAPRCGDLGGEPR